MSGLTGQSKMKADKFSMSAEELDAALDEIANDLGPVARADQRKEGRAAHDEWERDRGTENECDAESRFKGMSSAWWSGWFDRSDEWRDEIGHETEALS